MKRNTILISVLGVAGLLAVWWFMLRRASAADPLADTLTGTETSGTATLGSSQLAGGSGTDLLSTLTGLVTALTGKPASGTTSTTPASSTLAPFASANPDTWASVSPPKVKRIPGPSVSTLRANREKADLSKVPVTFVSKPVPRSMIIKSAKDGSIIKKL